MSITTTSGRSDLLRRLAEQICVAHGGPYKEGNERLDACQCAMAKDYRDLELWIQELWEEEYGS